MRTFVINLEKNKERLANMQDALRELNVEFIRFPAVYGKDLSLIERRRALNGFAWLCTQGYPARDGQIGCALSHIQIYQKMIQEDITACCILEDDVAFSSEYPFVVSYIEKHLDISRPQVILLHCHYSEYAGKDVIQTGCEIKPIVYERCAESYILTKKAAEALLALNYPIKHPCDHWFYFAKTGRIELLQAFPTTCKQKWDDDYRSDVYEGKCVDVRKFGLVKKLGWRCWRLVGKTIAYVARM